jgi:outer membrane protein OmpU
MKKILLGTSAVALASAFTTSAHAVDWEVVVGGYMEQYAAWSSPDVNGIVDDDFDGIDNKGEAEIHFKPSITLDNGLKIGADVQLEGNGFGGTPDTIDESFLFLDGSFGRVLLGSENSAGYLMNYGAPDVTFLNVNSGSLTKFIPYSGTAFGEVGVDLDGDAVLGDVAGLETGDDIFRGTLGSTFIENGRNNDAQRFTYFTPRFAGFQLGVSYARDPRQDDQNQLNLDVQERDLSNIFDVGANYVNSFGAFDIAVSGRYGIATNDDGIGDVLDDDEDVEDVFGDNPQIWSAGLNLGYAGFTIGGSFAEQNGTIADDGQGWDAGIAYETGPWGISFTYFDGNNTDDENFAIGADEELKQYLLGVNYDLAKGVAINAFGAYADFDEDTGDFNVDTVAGPDTGQVNPGGDDVDGWVVGTGIKISF